MKKVRDVIGIDVSKKTIENHMGLALKDMRRHLQDFR